MFILHLSYIYPTFIPHFSNISCPRIETAALHFVWVATEEERYAFRRCEAPLNPRGTRATRVCLRLNPFEEPGFKPQP